MYLNGREHGIANAFSVAETGDYETFSLQSTLDLKEGDQVWFQSLPAALAFLYDNSAHSTHFTGWLLQEDITFY